MGHFRGRLVYPLVMEVLNAPNHLRTDPSCRALLAYLPVTGELFSESSKKASWYAPHHCRVTWAVLDLVLKNILPNKRLVLDIGGKPMQYAKINFFLFFFLRRHFLFSVSTLSLLPGRPTSPSSGTLLACSAASTARVRARGVWLPKRILRDQCSSNNGSHAGPERLPTCERGSWMTPCPHGSSRHCPFGQTTTPPARSPPTSCLCLTYVSMQRLTSSTFYGRALSQTCTLLYRIMYTDWARPRRPRWTDASRAFPPSPICSNCKRTTCDP